MNIFDWLIMDACVHLSSPTEIAITLHQSIGNFQPKRNAETEGQRILPWVEQSMLGARAPNKRPDWEWRLAACGHSERLGKCIFRDEVHRSSQLEVVSAVLLPVHRHYVCSSKSTYSHANIGAYSYSSSRGYFSWRKEMWCGTKEIGRMCFGLCCLEALKCLGGLTVIPCTKSIIRKIFNSQHKLRRKLKLLSIVIMYLGLDHQQKMYVMITQL